MPSFGGEVKPSAPCCRFAVCERSLNGVKRHNFGKITGHHSRPQFHLSLLGVLALLRTRRHLVAKVGTSKGRGKQWQTTPKNLPRMQRARAIPIAWLGSGPCQDWPKGRTLIIIMCVFYDIVFWWMCIFLYIFCIHLSRGFQHLVFKLVHITLV
jgi:hypothetical protein